MTDLSVVPNTPAEPAAPQAPITEEQKKATIREFMLGQLKQKYDDLSKVVKQMNLPQHIEYSLFWDLDSWYGMAQQMTALMNFAPPQQPQFVPSPPAAEPVKKAKRKYKLKAKNGKRKPA